jgi:hypothetical protein
MKLLTPPQARFNRKGNQMPVTWLHDASQPHQLITSQPPRPLHFGEELQTRFRVLGQLAVLDCQHEDVAKKRKMPVDRCIAPEALWLKILQGSLGARSELGSHFGLNLSQVFP